MVSVLCNSHRRPDTTHLANLYRKAAYFLVFGLAPSTISTYSAGKKRYSQFCSTSLISPMPSYESTLILFGSHLTAKNISHMTIKVYLSALCHMHVVAGLHDLFTKQLTPRLQLVLRGIKVSSDYLLTQTPTANHPPDNAKYSTDQLGKSANCTTHPLPYQSCFRNTSPCFLCLLLLTLLIIQIHTKAPI